MSDMKAVSIHGWWYDLDDDPDVMELVGTHGWWPQDIVTYLGTDFLFLFSSITTEQNLLSSITTEQKLMSTLL